MKHFFLLFYLLFFVLFISQAQEQNDNPIFIDLESGINLSQFNFSNSGLSSDFKNADFSPTRHQAIKFGFLSTSNINVLLGLDFDSYQIIGQPIDMMYSHSSYDFNYVSLKFGTEYSQQVNQNLNMLLAVSGSYKRLVSGFQNIGSATYDLSNSSYIDNIYGYTIGAGFLYQMTNRTGIYFKYDWHNTLDINEINLAENYQIRSFVYSTGLRFNLK